MKPQFPASDEFIVWAQSLSGMITSIRTKYGSASEMVERSDWDESKTEHALKLMQALKASASQVEEELEAHASGKFG